MTNIANSPYPAPIYPFQNRGANGSSTVVDCGACTAARQPPVIVGTFSSGADMDVRVEQSHDATNWAIMATLDANFAKDIVQGMRFLRVTVLNWVTGTFTASIGAVSTQSGNLVVPNFFTTSNNVPTTSG